MTDQTASADLPEGPVLAADGRPLKASLNRALRRQKLRALMLIAPLFLFILITFVWPIGAMLFRSVENQIVEETLPRTVVALQDWEDTSTAPDEAVFAALSHDLVEAVERRRHTQVGSRLNYETTGMSSLFRSTGRSADEVGEWALDGFVAIDPAWEEPETWTTIFGSSIWLDGRETALANDDQIPLFQLGAEIRDLLPEASDAYRGFAQVIQTEDGDDPSAEEPWAPVYGALYRDLAQADPASLAAIGGASGALLTSSFEALSTIEPVSVRDEFAEINDDWVATDVWATIEAFSDPYTAGYFLSAVDLQLSPEGIEQQPEDQRIYLKLFWRTIVMSLVITGSCILLGYPIAYLLATLPLRTSNLLLILVLLPFWTSLLVRTSAWKVLLQDQGVINDMFVWAGLVADGSRLALINNQTGTIIAMTHIILPFMILPLYSVMKTIPITYVRAAKSLGATNWTAFWRVYFPQSVPGIGAGSILVFILAIGYYITPELVGGESGIFISNRIAFHIRSSLNWGLAAALGTILLTLVLVLYWLYDRMVGIDNVKLGG